MRPGAAAAAALADFASESEDDGDDAGEHPLRWPPSVGAGVMHVALLPLLLAWHLTLPSRASLHQWCATQSNLDTIRALLLAAWVAFLGSDF